MPTNHSLDIQQRLLLPKRFLEHLLSPADSSDSPFWALHIGGTPDSGCVESNHKQRIITLDRTPCVADDHIRADETNLPFASKVFESVIAVDFLEQVPPGNRSRFLAETARVSCGWLLINGPFRSPALEQAEQSVNDLHRVILGRPNDLLESHWQYGLPELAETREELEKLGFASAVVPTARFSTGSSSSPSRCFFIPSRRC